ncbi:MAG: hypothetical protein HQ518_19015 [Rhodopirellula sp.]|nr:hypothetical protein [Rhodopirellula sp.]
MGSRLESLLGIPSSHHRQTGLLFLFAFGMSGAYVSSRADADAMFLARIGLERLPAMILVAASGVAIVTAVYARTVARLPLQFVILTTHLLLATVTLLLALAVNSGSQKTIIPAALYLIAELRGALGSIQFATLLNEMFRSSAPASISGVASAGSTLSGILLGALTGWLAGHYGAASVLFLIPCLDLFAGFVALRCMNQPPSDRLLTDSSIAGPVTSGKDDSCDVEDRRQVQTLKDIPLVRYIVGIVCLKTVVVLLVEYEWKSAASARFSVENELAEFFGAYYAVMFLLTACLQLFGTSRVLTRMGSRAGLAAFPGSVTIALSTIFITANPAAMFWCLTMARGCDVLRRGLTDTAMHLLYWPLGPAVRRQVIALSGGWIKPLTEAVAAIILIPLAATLSDRELSLMIVALCCVWLGIIYFGNRPRAKGQAF